MRPGAEDKGRVAIALAIGLGAAVAYAQQAQQLRPPSGSREATLPIILSIEDDRASTQGDLQVLLGALRGPLADRAIRALGRLERRDVITDLLPYLATNSTRAATALALGLALRGPALEGVPHGQQEGVVREALLAAGETQLHAAAPLGLDHFSRTLGRLPINDLEAFRAVETFLRHILEKPFPQVQDAPHVGAARGLESLARLRRKIATLDDETITQLRTVARTVDPRRADQQRNALAALIAASSVDAETLEIVLVAGAAEVRRLAVLALSGSASAIGDEELALAKRDRERAAISMLSFAMHPTWQVRMYTARAAAIVDDVPVLTRLASDPDDNVAEAALTPLRRLIGADSDAVFVEALNRRTRTVQRHTVRPYEIIRTAARALDKATPTPAIVNALASALERISLEQCETSRDTRLALIDRLAQLGSAAQASTLTPLFKEIDPMVARAASEVLTRWTGKGASIDTPQLKSANIPTAADLANRVSVTFKMDRGRRFEVQLNAAEAPLARTRFLDAVRRGYYNNLTFHRVVPNFIIQGGSPGANEYCGDCPFMRDEVGGMHERGTIGISTRGPDTGDAQIFINLVDNPRLDFDYTVFARVCSGMDVVDEIQEGDRIAEVRILQVTPGCGE